MTTQDESPNASSSDQPSNPSSKKGKDKKIFSCRSCRRRKLRCDRFDPCGACLARREGHQCMWEEGQRPERHHRESLEQVPKLILNLTEQIQELKTSNSALIENLRGANGGESQLETLDLMTPDLWLPVNDTSTRWSLPPAQLALPEKSDHPSRQVMALLPDSPLLRALISHYIFFSAALTGFIDIHLLISDLEKIEHFRQQGLQWVETSRSLDLQVSQILACASLGAVALDPAQAQELGITDIDALVRDLYRKARALITPGDEEMMHTFTATTTITTASNNSLSDQSANHGLLSHAPRSQFDPTPLRVVSIKILLLLAARSFAPPSEYLKLHLDVIWSAFDACLDSPRGASMSSAESEWSWQLWSTLCVLDWTSPGIYHHGSYFIRAEMCRDPPPVVGMEDDHLNDRLRSTRHYLEHALVLAHLSRRTEDCILRPGPVSPTHAACLCAELDALDRNLSFYQPLAGGGGGEESRLDWHASPWCWSSRIWSSVESQGDLAHRAPRVQQMHLSLELQLIRFKLFRQETFHLIHEGSLTASAPLRLMCIDTCIDSCILVLAQCQHIIGNNQDRVGVDHHLPDLFEATKQQPSYRGNLRLLLQPASSAALVGQVLLHASRSAEMSLALGPADHVPQPHLPGGGGCFSFASPDPEDHWGSHSKPCGRNLSTLQWHVDAILSLLESLQGTSSLVRYRLNLHRQCI